MCTSLLGRRAFSLANQNEPMGMNRPKRGDITHRAFQFPHLPRDKSHVTQLYPQQV